MWPARNPTIRESRLSGPEVRCSQQREVYTSSVNLKRSRRCLLGWLVAVCLLRVSAAWGQSAGLHGKVLDVTGGGIAATITLFSEDRVLTVKANQDGSFEFPSLPTLTRWLKFSSPGFFSTSAAVTENMPDPVLVTLRVGEQSGCFVRPELAKINGVGYMSNSGPPNPSDSYGERRDNVYVAGSVWNAWGGPLAMASLTLLQTDTNSPMETREVKVGGNTLYERHYPERVIAEVTSNDRGVFQFSDLQPGSYTVRAALDGYWSRDIGVWVARENVTRLSPLYLFPQRETHPCSGGSATEPSTVDSPLPLIPLSSPQY
jgi:hypothetical protein